MEEELEPSNHAKNLSLPKATVQKIVTETIPIDFKANGQFIDLLIQCCIEFVQLVSSEANEVCDKEKKKTISPEHLMKALKDLGFDKYAESVQSVYEKQKVENKERPRKSSKRKLEDLGIPHEELLRRQQELFAQARQSISGTK